MDVDVELQQQALGPVFLGPGFSWVVGRGGVDEPSTRCGCECGVV